MKNPEIKYIWIEQKESRRDKLATVGFKLLSCHNGLQTMIV